MRDSRQKNDRFVNFREINRFRPAEIVTDVSFGLPRKVETRMPTTAYTEKKTLTKNQ